MTIHYDTGGTIASAWPQDHPNMRISWELLSGEVFFAHNGRRIAGNVCNLAGFKREAERLFGKVLGGEEV